CGFGFLVVLSVGLAIYAVTEFGSIKTSVGKMNALSENATRALEIDESFEKMRRAILRYAYDHDEPSLKEFDEVAGKAIATLQAAEKATLSEELRKMYLGLQSDVPALQAKGKQLADTVKRAEAEKAKLHKSDDDLTASTHKLVETVQAGDNQKLALMAAKVDAQLLSVGAANWRAQATSDPKGIAVLKEAVSQASMDILILEKSDGTASMREMLAPLKAALAQYATEAESVTENLIKIGDLYRNQKTPW